MAESQITRSQQDCKVATCENPILRFCADAAKIALRAAEYARSKGLG